MSYCAWNTKSSVWVDSCNAAFVMVKMKKYGYVAEFDENGNIIGVGFPEQTLSLDEDEMFQEIAPFILSGSFIEMRGADGQQWRQVFRDGTCKRVKAEISWPE